MLSVALRLTPSLFNKWKMLRWYTYQASFIDIESAVFSLQIFIPREAVILGHLWVDFGPELKAPDKILGVSGPKKLWMLWRRTRKWIFRETSMEKYDFSGGGRSSPIFVKGPRTPKNVFSFDWNFDQWWRTRWWIRYATVFIEVVRNGQNWAKKLIFWLILIFCSYPLTPYELHPKVLIVGLKISEWCNTILWSF